MVVSSQVGVLSSEDLVIRAKSEVNEEAERVASDIQAIKDWLVKQPHLQNIRNGGRFFHSILLKK